MQDPDAPSTPGLAGSDALQRSMADMMTFEELPQPLQPPQPLRTLHITSQLLYPPPQAPLAEDTACDMLPCWERGPALAWPQARPQPVNLHLLQGFLSEDEAYAPLMAPHSTPSASLCMDPTQPEQAYLALEEPFVWDVRDVRPGFCAFEPFLHAPPTGALPAVEVALKRGPAMEQQDSLAQDQPQQFEGEQFVAWEVFPAPSQAMQEVPLHDLVSSPSHPTEADSDSESQADTEYEFVEGHMCMA